MAALARQRYWFPTGSAVVSPQVRPNDYDYVLLYHPYVGARMRALGFKQTSPYRGKKFSAWKLGQINLIMLADRDEFERWRLATKVAQAFAPDSKRDRVRIFDIFLEQGR
jgi:4-hydroxyphenylpyruvate dioxygenase-like putative hemolysin